MGARGGVSGRIVSPRPLAGRLGQEVIIRPSRSFGSPLGREQRGRLQPRLFSPRRFDDFIFRSRGTPAPLAGRLSPNVAGRLPEDMVSIDRHRSPFLGDRFRGLAGRFGEPRHRFFFTPRERRFRDFDFDRHDRFRDFGRFRHHRTVALNFFYPFYFSDPFFLGFNYPGFFPSPYSYFGWTPGWIYPSQGYYSPGAYDSFGESYGNYSLDRRGAEAAIEDVRRAWLEDDMDRLAAHLSDQYDVQVSLDGQYQYTTSDKDYYAMTLDTLSTTRTTSMSFGDPTWLAPDQVVYTGQQVFTDPDGESHTLYVSYRLQQADEGTWYIIGYDSSYQPLTKQYSDFRSGY